MERQSQSREQIDVMSTIYERARAADATVILAESDDERVVEAAKIIEGQGLAKLVLLDENSFEALSEEEQQKLVDVVQKARAKENFSADDARQVLKTDTKYLAAALVKLGKADGFVAGNKTETAETIRPAVKVIGTPNKYASSFFIMLHKSGPVFFADCGFNINPNSEELAKIAIDTAANVRMLGMEPRVAFLSFSTGASLEHEHINKMREAITIARAMAPELKISEHELQFDAAFKESIGAKKAPKSLVAGNANVFIFPDLNSGNIAYKVAQHMGEVQPVGPIFQGFNAPVNDLSRGCTTQEIVDVVAVTAMQAGALKEKRRVAEISK